MMPILVKGDDVRSETKVNARHSLLQAAQVTGLKGTRKFQ